MTDPMTFIFITVIGVLLALLIFAVSEVHHYKTKFENLTKDYNALDEGMTELGESMQADLLDAQEGSQQLRHVIKRLDMEREILFRIAKRCHATCLPQFHGYTQEEQDLLDYLEVRYEGADET